MKNGRTGSLIASCLPQSCLQTTVSGIRTLQHVRSFSIADLSQKLSGVAQRALRGVLNPKHTSSLPLIGLEQLVGQSEIDLTVSAIVDWSAPTGVPVQISTVDSQITFKSNRTYVLFGLTSDLAQSICDWMASHGARNIVLTSRNPRIEAKWIELLGNTGVRLEVFAK
jgi:hybrid polyketide synthase/nonribosomal peptide synthetase ACE1